MSEETHQERTERVLKESVLNDVGGDYSAEALWQIAHSLAAIADALTFSRRWVTSVDVADWDEANRESISEAFRLIKETDQ